MLIPVCRRHITRSGLCFDIDRDEDEGLTFCARSARISQQLAAYPYPSAVLTSNWCVRDDMLCPPGSLAASSERYLPH